MGAVIDPFARCGDPLAGRDHWGMPDQRDQFAVAACLDPQNTETVLLIVVGDALGEARQHFLGRWLRPRLHVDCRVICFASAGVCNGKARSPNQTPYEGCARNLFDWSLDAKAHSIL